MDRDELSRLRVKARAALGEAPMLRLDRGGALFVTDSPVTPEGFAQETRGNGLYALSPVTGYPAETARIYIALLKQTERRDTRFPSLVRDARRRMALCQRLGERDPGLKTLETLIGWIEEPTEEREDSK